MISIFQGKFAHNNAKGFAVYPMSFDCDTKKVNISVKMIFQQQIIFY